MKNTSSRRKAMEHLINCIADDDPGKTPKDINWPEVIALAKLHKVIPQLYQNMRNHLPTAESEKLKKSFLANAAKNAFVTEELLRILTLLRSQDITAVPFKGPTLALQAYGDLSMRQFDDIDLIIPADQILNAIKLLTDDDYQPDIELPDSATRGYLKSRQDWTLHTPTSNTCLDIQPVRTSPTSYLTSALTGSPAEKEAVSYKDLTIDCLTASDTLEGICVHGNRHLWYRLSWILDVSALMKKLTEDEIESAIAKAHKHGTLLRLLLGLNLANEVLKANLPDCVKNMINSRPVLKHLTKVSLATLYSYPSAKGALHNWAYQLKSMDYTTDKLKQLTRHIFVPTKVEFSVIPLPSYAYPLYHIIRPLRLIRSTITQHRRQ